MRAAIVDPMGLDNLKIVDVPDVEPGPGEVVVALKAASLNYRDILAVEGGYGSMQKQEKLIPLSDGAGEVVKVGAGVREWKEGDRVVGTFFPDWQSGPLRPEAVRTDLGGGHDGVAVERRVFRADAIARIPDDLSYLEASTLPCAAATAWNALIENGDIGPGSTVLTQGTGGVSLFALQFAVMAGAEVYSTSSSAEKIAKLKELGASHTVNYREEEDWGKAVQKLGRGRGIDHVVDIGGGGTLKQSMISLALGGTITMIGVVAGPKAELNVPIVAMRDVRIRGANAGSRDSLKRMIAAIAHHGMKPVIDEKVFTLDQLKDAILYLKSGKHVGKVCVEI